MKISGMLSIVILLMLGWITSHGQATEPEVPGDHFSLEGALELFKKSESPEEFEKLLNSADSKVNNLDLNGDGYIDYVRVLDRYEGSVHAFIIQAVIAESEYQDIAVIELEKLSNGKAVLQIVGNEDIYGVETIIEPTREVRTYAGTRSNNTVVNVWAWPSVQYVYGPRYTVWVSPWGWYSHPVWWRTWRPIAYVHYSPIWYSYRPYYSVCHTRRVVYAHEIYRPYRTTSVVVHRRYHDKITRYRSTRHDNDHGRVTGNDGRRSSERDRRSSSVNSSERQRENEGSRGRISGEERSVASRDRSDLGNPELSNDVTRRTALSSRRSASAENNREIRTPESRRPAEKSKTEQQRTVTKQRAVPSDVQGTSSGIRREEFSTRRSSVSSNAPIRQQVTRPSTNQRTRSESSNIQRSSTRERSAPSEIHRGATPSRNSVSVPASRDTRQQPSGSSVNRSRSSDGPGVAPRGRSSEIKKGRQ